MINYNGNLYIFFFFAQKRIPIHFTVNLVKFIYLYLAISGRKNKRKRMIELLPQRNSPAIMISVDLVDSVESVITKNKDEVSKLNR